MKTARGLLQGYNAGTENNISEKVRALEDAESIRLSQLIQRQEALDFRAIDDAGNLRVIMSAISLQEEFGVPAYLLARNLLGTPTWYINADDGNGYMRGDMNHLMEWWQSLGQRANQGAHIFAMAYDAANNCIYLGGLFTMIGGVSASNIAKYDLTTKTFSALGSGLNDTVAALCVASDGVLYVGGYFTNAGGDANADKFCKYTGGAFSACGTSFAGQAGNVLALAESKNGYILIGGSFTNVLNANGDYFVAWIPAAPTYATVPIPLNGAVAAIAVDSNNVWYVGGAFTNAGGDADADKFCKSTTGGVFSACGTAFAGCAGDVVSISIDANGLVYPAGNFANIGDANGDGVVQFDPVAVAYTSLGSGSPGGGYNYIAAIGDYVYLSFTTLTPPMVNWVWRWTGTEWEEFGGGLGGNASAIIEGENDNVYFGGAFLTDAADETEMCIFARYGSATLKEILDYLLLRAYAVSSPLGCAPGATIPAATTLYIAPYQTAFQTGTALATFIAPRPGLLRNMYVRTRTAQPLGGRLIVDAYGGAGAGPSVVVDAGDAAAVYSDLATIYRVEAGESIRFYATNEDPANPSAEITSIQLEFV